MRAVSFLVGGLLMLTGCVVLPVGPSVAVMPAPAKPFEVFVADETVCRQYAAQQAGLVPPQAAEQSVLSGAVAGTALGAAAGAGTGLLVGTAVGADTGYGASWRLQWLYDVAYEQCMYAKGNQVPGFPLVSPPPPTVPPPR